MLPTSSSAPPPPPPTPAGEAESAPSRGASEVLAW